jgi:hypothetical protein
MKWTERQIARALAQKMFNRKYLVVVPNCSWPGSECDVLALTENLRVIDVEIKISRADLKADAKKYKWQHGFDAALDGGYEMFGKHTPRRREWPRRVWKHYYALPADIWDDSLLESLGSESSGVLLLHEADGQIYVMVRRMAKPDREAQPISAANAIDVARMANLRMWDAHKEIEQLKKQLEQVCAS